MAAPLHYADRLTEADIDGLIAHWATVAAWYGPRVAEHPYFAADVAACRDREQFWTAMRETYRRGTTRKGRDAH